MKNKSLAVLVVAAGLLLFAAPLFAHHSAAMYDSEHPVTLTGTVTALKLINPHSLIRFEVKDENGKVVKWIAGMGPPQRMYRAGWNRNTINPEDQITITGNPAKDGRPVMSTLKIVLNGKELD